MQQQFRIQIGGPGGGPGQNRGPGGVVARVLWSIVAVVLLLTAAFLGAIFFLAALGFFMFGVLVLAVRVWWARRKFAKTLREGGVPPGPAPAPGQENRARVIEGEYRVVGEGQEERDARRDRQGDR
jgi:predicted lipid-binding transport protein (Tim44 family)